MSDEKEVKKYNEDGSISFSCRSPVYMCATCTHAEKCRDLLNILRLFKYEEVNFDYLGNFPFLEVRDGKKDPRNKRNELTSSEWLNFTKTAISAKLPNILGHELRRKHPAYKNPIIFGQMIAFFTAVGETVLDPFAGTGSSLIAASLLGRSAVGFEIETSWIDIYHRICEKEGLKPQTIHHADASTISTRTQPGSIDFAVIDPPDPLVEEEWLGREPPPSLEIYFNFIAHVLADCSDALKSKKHLAVITKNHYLNGGYFFLTAGYIHAAERAGLAMKGEKIWINTAEKIKPYGYPHSYVPNISHLHILFFQKPE